MSLKGATNTEQYLRVYPNQAAASASVAAAAANNGLWWRLKIDPRPIPKRHYWLALAADAAAWYGYTLT